MMKHAGKLAVCLALAMATGCASLSEVQKGAIVGGTAGAAVGLAHEAIFGGMSESGEFIVGGLAGGLVGALVGDYMERRAGIAKYEDEIKKATTDRDACAEKLRKCEADKAALTQEVADLKRKISELERRISALTDELNACKGARVEISVSNDILFGSGKAVLTDAGKKALDEAAKKVKDMGGDKMVQVEGHTDTDPIKASNWKSNWELGAARALAVLHYLEDKHGIKSAALSASTYSMYKPVGANDSAANKSKNRRCVIVVYTKWPTN